MDPLAQFFADNIIVVYFCYGLAFFIMGLVIWLESNRTSEFRIASAFILLAAFGIIHGMHEWYEMFQLLKTSGVTTIPNWLLLDELRIAHLVVSFLLLIVFGVRLLFSTHRKDGGETKLAWIAAGIFLALWVISALVTKWLYQPEQDEFMTAIDVLSRYIIGIPGALLAAWAIVLQQRSFQSRSRIGFGRDLQWAAWALILYGVIGQAFPPESFIFPANILNSRWFFETFGIPIQFFRAVEAALMAIFFIRALRAFELERRERMTQAQEEKIAAQKETLKIQQDAQRETEQLNLELREREELLAKLLHQVVSVQEGERQRIARELHDGAGQILTGLGLGLAAANESVKSDPALAADQLAELKRLNAQALEELHNIIVDLRPSVLDDLGLVPALNAQVQQFESRTGVKARLEVIGRRIRLQPELETILFRIGQEALTNIAKHAKADSVCMRLLYHQNCIKLVIEDNGCGFEPEATLKPVSQQRTAWGLLGIQERVALVGGVCFIISKPDSGTTIHITVPLMNERKNHVEN